MYPKTTVPKLLINVSQSLLIDVATDLANDGVILIVLPALKKYRAASALANVQVKMC